MSKREPPNQEAFDNLLLWLNPDRDKAGEKYEKIRNRLIQIFASRGCLEAEDLADQTINVVASKIDWLLEHYEGEPTIYFYAVAQKLHLEHLKRKPPPDVLRFNPHDPEVERLHSCLDKCLEQLSPDERELVIRYQEGDKKARIEQRKKLAAELNITRNALRIRVFYIHSRLEKCIVDCLKDLPDA